ncbi:MAG: PKD domain-containing protein, partial [Deltaproteobacteria bacterium]|nr:PKD domain-containing protein [Deltaproteobacteria bacterium]
GTAKYQSSFNCHAEAYGTGNGCTGCHEIHTSIVVGEKPFREECNTCHHVKNLENLMHPAGPGTPLEKAEEDPMEACVMCHMPEGQHLFRISTDAAYSTFPPAQTLTANTAANTAPDGTYQNAVWVDLDAACGQCHGGGTANAKTTGTIATGSAALTVASTTGLAVGERINVAGAGAFAKSGTWYDLHTFIKAIAGNVVTLAGSATHGVTNAAVTQNPTTNDASYQTKANLALLAKGIHNDSPEAKFTVKQGANELTVAVDASGTKCRGNSTNCGAFDWNWGDNTEHGSGKTATHAYAKAGTYTITLAVEDEETGTGSSSQAFVAKAIPGAPVVTGACTPDYPKASVSCEVTVPTGGYTKVEVYFGEGYGTTAVLNPPVGPLTLNHTYSLFNNYTILATATNAAGQSTTGPIGYMSRGMFVNDKNR